MLQERSKGNVREAFLIRLGNFCHDPLTVLYKPYEENHRIEKESQHIEEDIKC